METCNAASVRHLLAVARRYAARAGLDAADADDCAVAFVESHFASAPPPDTRCSEAWWNTCASHYVLNWLRARKRREQHEFPWREPGRADGPDDSLDPQRALLQKAFQCDLKNAVRELEPLARKVFLRRAFRGMTAPQLAERFDKTPEAIYKILSRAAKQVRALLERQGWTQADVCRCFDSPPPRASTDFPFARSTTDLPDPDE